ncbi:hypothetical protein AN221_16440 [Streptomyces nanshensis]|uniref:Uncharacterized protein n=1 Tax=Streptomyces nanshensis TaxID=518642 RepID=A0A1E7LT95_9ACTN|nr:hypothetical protein AN221_16440 [Streptomyces nanshensis]
MQQHRLPDGQSRGRREPQGLDRGGIGSGVAAHQVVVAAAVGVCRPDQSVLAQPDLHGDGRLQYPAASTGCRLDQALLFEEAQRLGHGVRCDTELLTQLTLTGELLARGQPAAQDVGAQCGRDLFVRVMGRHGHGHILPYPPELTAHPLDLFLDVIANSMHHLTQLH